MMEAAALYGLTLGENCSYSELFWSVLSRIWTGYGEILRISPYSVRIRENTDQNYSEYVHFSRSDISLKKWQILLIFNDVDIQAYC